jgi:hypothetical protein
MNHAPNNGQVHAPAATVQQAPLPGDCLLGHLPPQAAIASWEQFRPYLAEALEWGDGRETEASLFAKIVHGQNLLFAVLQAPRVLLAGGMQAGQPRPVGIACLEISLDGATCNIVALALHGEKELFPSVIRFLRQLLGPVIWFECYSRRPGMERFLTGHGWRQEGAPPADAPEDFKRFVIGRPYGGMPIP